MKTHTISPEGSVSGWGARVRRDEIPGKLLGTDIFDPEAPANQGYPTERMQRATHTLPIKKRFFQQLTTVPQNIEPLMQKLAAVRETLQSANANQASLKDFFNDVGKAVDGGLIEYEPPMFMSAAQKARGVTAEELKARYLKDQAQVMADAQEVMHQRTAMIAQIDQVEQMLSHLKQFAAAQTDGKGTKFDHALKEFGDITKALSYMFLGLFHLSGSARMEVCMREEAA